MSDEENLEGHDTNKAGRPKRQASSRIVDFSVFNERGFDQSSNDKGTGTESGSENICPQGYSSGAEVSSLTSRSWSAWSLGSCSESLVSSEHTKLFEAIIDRQVPSIQSARSSGVSSVSTAYMELGTGTSGALEGAVGGESPQPNMATSGDNVQPRDKMAADLMFPTNPQEGETGVSGAMVTQVSTSGAGAWPKNITVVSKPPSIPHTRVKVTLPTDNLITTVVNTVNTPVMATSPGGAGVDWGQDQTRPIYVAQGAGSGDSLQPDPFGYIIPGTGLVDGNKGSDNPGQDEVLIQLSNVKQKHNELIDRFRNYKEKQKVADDRAARELKHRDDMDRARKEEERQLWTQREDEFQRRVEDMERRFKAHEEELRMEQVQAALEHRRQMTDLEHKLTMQKLAAERELEKATVEHQLREYERLQQEHVQHTAQQKGTSSRIQSWVNNVESARTPVNIDNNLNAVQAAIQRGDATLDRSSGINVLRQAGIAADHLDTIQAHARGGTAAVAAALSQSNKQVLADVRPDLQNVDVELLGATSGLQTMAGAGPAPPQMQTGPVTGDREPGARRTSHWACRHWQKSTRSRGTWRWKMVSHPFRLYPNVNVLKNLNLAWSQNQQRILNQWRYGPITAYMQLSRLPLCCLTSYPLNIMWQAR